MTINYIPPLNGDEYKNRRYEILLSLEQSGDTSFTPYLFYEGCPKKDNCPRSISITIIIIFVLISIVLIARPSRAEWECRQGKGYVLCEELRKRLNNYQWDPKEVVHYCAWDVVASYPKFKEPPWEDLDPKIHEELIYKLLKYRACGVDGYFGKSPCQIVVPEEVQRNEVRKFIEDGGRIQVWRKRLIREFADGPAPPEPQTIIQLRRKSPLESIKKRCPEIPLVDWRIGGLYIVKDDFSGPDPRVKPWAFYLKSSTVMIFSHEIHYIGFGGEVVIGIDRDGMPSDFCILKYNKKSQRRKP